MDLIVVAMSTGSMRVVIGGSRGVSGSSPAEKERETGSVWTLSLLRTEKSGCPLLPSPMLTRQRMSWPGEPILPRRRPRRQARIARTSRRHKHHHPHTKPLRRTYCTSLDPHKHAHHAHAPVAEARNQRPHPRNELPYRTMECRPPIAAPCFFSKPT